MLSRPHAPDKPPPPPPRLKLVTTADATAPPDPYAAELRRDAIRFAAGEVVRTAWRRLRGAGPLGDDLAEWLRRHEQDLETLLPTIARLLPDFIALFGPELRLAILDLLAEDLGELVAVIAEDRGCNHA